MNYLRCVNNKGFIWQNGKLLDEELVSLTVGALYKAVPTAEEDQAHDLVRVIDNSGEDYLYPSNRFEVFEPDLQAPATDSMTIYVPPDLWAILRAEALAQGMSLSGLLRQWAEERLDLPA